MLYQSQKRKTTDLDQNSTFLRRLLKKIAFRSAEAVKNFQQVELTESIDDAIDTFFRKLNSRVTNKVVEFIDSETPTTTRYTQNNKNN